jgi:hypothetical protein
VFVLQKHEAEHLLEHWIEHNQSHSLAFRDRADQIEEISKEAAAAVKEAAHLMDNCTERLVKAKELL